MRGFFALDFYLIASKERPTQFSNILMDERSLSRCILAI